MPIPQSRLIDLLEAALDYKHAFTDLCRIVGEHSRTVDDRQLRAIARYSIDNFLINPTKTNTTMVLEEERIRHTRRYNEARRAKAALKQQIPSMQTPEDLENEALAKQAGFSTFAAYQDYLFSSSNEDEPT